MLTRRPALPAETILNEQISFKIGIELAGYHDISLTSEPSPALDSARISLACAHSDIFLWHFMYVKRHEFLESKQKVYITDIKRSAASCKILCTLIYATDTLSNLYRRVVVRNRLRKRPHAHEGSYSANGGFWN